MAHGLARLKKRADFLRVAGARRSAARPGLVLQAAAQPTAIGPTGIEPTGIETGAAMRIGFTASRRVGNAVTRNRAKRRLRAAAAEVLRRDGRPGTDYVLIARAGTGARAYAELVGDLRSALRQLDRRDASRPRREEES